MNSASFELLKREPSSFELDELDESSTYNDPSFNMVDLMHDMSIDEEGTNNRPNNASPKPLERVHSTASDVSMSSFNAAHWLSVGGRSFSEGENSLDELRPNVRKEVLTKVLQQQQPPSMFSAQQPSSSPAAPSSNSFTSAFGASSSLDALAALAPSSSSDASMGMASGTASPITNKNNTSLVSALLFAGDDSEDEDEPHAQFLGRELLTSHVSALKYESSFFGCYWRNRNNNVCGFPCVGSVSGNMDYQTWQHQQKVRVVAVASGEWWWWCFFLVGVEECIATDPIVCFVLLFVQCISSRMLPMQHPETMMRYAF